jgi:MlaD protein
MRIAVGTGAVVLATVITACAEPAHFAAMFDSAGGLGPGDSVTHGGALIGNVTNVQPAASGDSTVSVRIDAPYAGDVHADSILILSSAGVAPSLELLTPDPSSAQAGAGAMLYGASNESQAQLLTSSLGPPTFVKRYAQFFSRMAPSPAAVAPTPAPGAVTMQAQLDELVRETLAAAAAASRSSPSGAAELAQFRRDAASVERQLIAHGRDADAERLRSEVARLGAAAPSPAPAHPPNTLTAPRVYPNP